MKCPFIPPKVAGRRHELSNEDVLVLPLDLCDFARHQEAVDKVMKHFQKVTMYKKFKKCS